MNRSLFVGCLVLCGAVSVGACSSSDSSSEMNAGAMDPGAPSVGDGKGTSEGSSPPFGGTGTGGDSASGAPSAGGQGGGDGGITAGTLTAGLWDDNANFSVFESYLSNGAQTYSSAPFFDVAARAAAKDAALAARPARTELDVAILLDATGSMGDELRYLQVEIDGIAASLKTKFPSVSPRWSLVVYRDLGDDYVVRTFAFTADTSVFRTELSKQSAGGGGDMPEAVPEGLEALVGQDWRTGDVAKMAFWFADAPHHDNGKDRVKAAITAAQGKGLHIYPVASSGSDALAELTMRVAAQMTGGRYLFLTDDSGVGGAHREPKVPCYHVTKLATAMQRSIAMELSGTFLAPETSDIVRTIGHPEGAACLVDTQDGG